MNLSRTALKKVKIYIKISAKAENLTLIKFRPWKDPQAPICCISCTSGSATVS